MLDKTLGAAEPSEDEERMKQATRDFGKSLVAWDEWGKNPARAAERSPSTSSPSALAAPRPD
ncbi:hypothetical protein [Streptomyces gobiensis]|uniref:hypothetical protein n=1 Tax=Streptomyces gobiensis TaxID=2875706 RepID=UPI001E5170E7|nr:hypothetical protein [Streptomyces gobiensis]UGY92796.1 hypothetical protein test1122_14455 [Streptomyces gobiensis]